MKLMIIVSVIIVSIVGFTGCTTLTTDVDTFYNDLKVGKFSGELQVQWIDFDKFVFTPSTDKPFTFTRYNGETIIPQKMLTDGGSIPYPLRAFKQYSPWGYAPAYLIHDWLYNQHRCNLGLKYTFEETSQILAEAIKTLMEEYKIDEYNKSYEYSLASSSQLLLKDPTILYSIYIAVSSKAGLDSFNNECQKARVITNNPIQSYTLKFK